VKKIVEVSPVLLSLCLLHQKWTTANKVKFAINFSCWKISTATLTTVTPSRLLSKGTTCVLHPTFSTRRSIGDDDVTVADSVRDIRFRLDSRRLQLAVRSLVTLASLQQTAIESVLNADAARPVFSLRNAATLPTTALAEDGAADPIQTWSSRF